MQWLAMLVQKVKPVEERKKENYKKSNSKKGTMKKTGEKIEIKTKNFVLLVVFTKYCRYSKV